MTRAFRRARPAVLAALGVLAAAYWFPVAFAALQSLVAPEEIIALHVDEASDVYGSLPCALLPRAFSWRQYYEVLLHDSAYLMSFWNSAALSLMCTALSGLVSVGLGFLLAKGRFFLRGAAVRFVAATMLLPWQAVMLPEYLLSRALGLYDSWAALVLVQGFSSLGVFLALQFLRAVPDELIDVASLDTSSSLTILARVACPIAAPGLAACAAMAFAESWSMVEQPMTLLRDELKYPLSMLVNTMSVAHMEIAFACAMVYLFPIVALYVFCGRGLCGGLAPAEGKGGEGA